MFSVKPLDEWTYTSPFIYIYIYIKYLDQFYINYIYENKFHKYE